jgi:hypothetical protein
MADLNEEIVVTEAAYTAAVVAEIASMRGQLGDRNWG